MTRNSIKHTEGIVAFPLQQWLRESATMLPYTYIAYVAYMTSIKFFQHMSNKTSE